MAGKGVLYLLFCCLLSPFSGTSKHLARSSLFSRSYSLPRAIRRNSFTKIHNVRGGGIVERLDDEDEDENDIGRDSMSIADEDFEGEGSINRRIRTIVEKTPPVTQCFLSLSVIITVLSCIFNQNQFPSFLLLNWKKVIRNGEYWRLLTSFLYFGPLDLSYLLTLQFVWQYMSQLEKVHHKHPEEFVMMVLSGAAFLLLAFSLIDIPSSHLGHNLSCFLVYVWSRTFEGHEVNCLELMIRSEFMPWFLALQTFLLEGEFPLMDLIGIAVGHVYYVLYTTKSIPTPLALKQFFENSEYLKERYSKVADDFGL